jgi:hypothetical protein
MCLSNAVKVEKHGTITAYKVFEVSKDYPCREEGFVSPSIVGEEIRSAFMRNCLWKIGEMKDAWGTLSSLGGKITEGAFHSFKTLGDAEKLLALPDFGPTNKSYDFRMCKDGVWRCVSITSYCVIAEVEIPEDAEVYAGLFDIDTEELDSYASTKMKIVRIVKERTE